jgi:hypothetical protein
MKKADIFRTEILSTLINEGIQLNNRINFKVQSGKGYYKEILKLNEILDVNDNFTTCGSITEFLNEFDYDRIIYTLKEHDKYDLNYLYQLFDSLQNTHQLSKKLFAEMIVSFVQTIPYTLILPKSCDANLYDDRFTVQYLQSKNAQCQGNERFGINTPVEFLGNLDGDCDTRALLLYTVLAHYGYDVVVLSSEHYGHSIIGINLPYNGASYPFNNQKYVFWETTAPNIRPGYLPSEISNTNYWRISLKSF